MREIVLWRWIFGLALLPTAGWAWLWYSLYPGGSALGAVLTLIPMYATSLVLVGFLALGWLLIVDFARDACEFLRELLGFRSAS